MKLDEKELNILIYALEKAFKIKNPQVLKKINRDVYNLLTKLLAKLIGK